MKPCEAFPPGSLPSGRPEISSFPPREDVAPGAGGRVLVVEDEAELAEILEYNLRKSGYTVFTAPDGLSACRLAAEARPDLILLDLLLPDLDGWEICKLIRGHGDEEIAATPIVMVTALGSLDDRLQGLELGADAYIPKPYSIREVLLKVRDLVAKRRKMIALNAEISSLRTSAVVQADIQQMLFHELRNQLLVLGGYSHLLARKGGELSREKSQAYAEAIQRSSGFLSTLAEEFLMVRRLQSGGLELPLEDLDMGRVVADTLLLYAPLLQEKEIRTELDCDGKPPAEGHYAATRLIVSVLVENALKYAPSRSPVTLRLLAAGEWMELQVEDRGPGIRPEELGRIFEKFFRGREAAGATSGTGLGLYFGRTLAEVMGGSLEAVSGGGAGSRFILRLRRSRRFA